MFSKMSLNRILVLFSCRYYASSKIRSQSKIYVVSSPGLFTENVASINSSVESCFEQQLYRSNRDASLHTKFSLTIIHVPVVFLIVLGGRDTPDPLDQKSTIASPSLPCSSWYTCSWCPRNCGKYIENLTRNQATLGHRVESQERSPSLSWRLMQTAQGQPSPPL